MKNLLITILLVVALSSCQDKYTETFRANVPVYISLEEWRSIEINVEGPRHLSEPGKIYIYENYLFIVERGAGIHILNNANPASPQNLAFLNVAGSVDLAVRNNTLYVDSYYDLLSFDISEPSSPVLSCRIENAFDFDNWTLVTGYDEDLPFTEIDSDKGVITGWTQQEVIQDTDRPETGSFDNAIIVNGTGNSFNVSSGIGGSMAQFTLTGSYLYVLRPTSITAFDLSADDCPDQSSQTAVSWNAETVFPYNNHLFIGTSNGMLIYNLNNPTQPEFTGQIEHVTACDPVVVQGDRAYLTIRTGTNCMGWLNQLEVIDISNYSSPHRIIEYGMTNPHGLGIDGNTLFVCDGNDGLKVYNAEDDVAIADNMIAHYENITTFDVIPHNNVLIMSAEEGVYQYDYSNPESIVQLSFIPSY